MTLSRNCKFLKFGIFLKLEIFNPILKFADLTASFSHFGVLAKPCSARLLRLCLSGCGAKQAAPLHACRWATHLQLGPNPLHECCVDSTAHHAWACSRAQPGGCSPTSCHFSSPNSLAVSYFKTPSLQPYFTVFLMHYSNLPGQAEGLQLNQPTTRPCN